MARSRFIFNRSHSNISGDDIYDDFLYSHTNMRIDDDDYDDDDDEYELSHSVPPSSSSRDRSSVGSIPWAYDAVKKNRVDWERVERALYAQEELPEEPVLRTEILEWQQKFPHIFWSKSQQTLECIFTNSLIGPQIMNAISNLSLKTINDQYDATESNDDDNNDDGDDYSKLGIFKNDRNSSSNRGSHVNPVITQINSKRIKESDLEICSAPIKLHRRHAFNGARYKHHISNAFKPEPPRQPVILIAAGAALPHPSPLKPASTDTVADNFGGNNNLTSTISTIVRDDNIYMPPILNVLESKRGFIGTNHSFVQLTTPPHISQSKSAAIENRQQLEKGRSSAWHLSLAAAPTSDPFFNKRNSIILPAINLYQDHETMSSDETNSRNGDPENLMSSFDDSYGANRSRNSDSIDKSVYKLRSNVDTRVVTSLYGRSISAIHPNTYRTSNPFYTPYRITNFKSFKIDPLKHCSYYLNQLV